MPRFDQGYSKVLTQQFTGMDKAQRKIMESVAKHMRFKMTTKSAVIRGQKVEYFTGIVSCN